MNYENGECNEKNKMHFTHVKINELFVLLRLFS